MPLNVPGETPSHVPPAGEETRFQSLLESLDAIVWEMDLSTWLFTYVSPRAEQLLGYPAQQWYTEPGFWAERLVHPDDRGWAVPFCVSATEEMRDHEFDYRAVAADGRVIWFRDVVRVIPDEQGRPRLLRGVMLDVTEQKEAAAAAAAAQQQHEVLLGAAAEGIYGLDPQGRTTFVNPAAAAMLGWAPEALVGRPQHALIHHTHPDGTPYEVGECPIHLSLQDGEARRVEDELFWRQDGSSFPVEYTCTPIRQNGVIAGAVVTFRDVGVQREHERALEERARHAALSADVGTAVAEGGPLGQVLQRCAEAVVTHLDAAFARVWTLNEAEQVLELQASAGLYTHRDGPHGRVPVGQFKIGLIAAERKAHLTNDVQHDPRVSDKEWARREGMTSFAGYPLLVEGELVGVIAMFARHPLGESTLEALRSVADRIALAIARNRAEEALRQRELQLAEAQRMAHLGSWQWELRTNEVRWSDELYRIYGLEPQSGPGTIEGYLERVHPEDRERVRAEIERVHAAGGTFDFEERIVRPDGSVRVLASRGRAVLGAGGRVVRLVGTCQDVTQQRQALDREIQLTQERLARAEAESSRRRITGILESISDAFFALDHDWRFTFLNPQAERLLQSSRTELLGRSIWEAFPEAVGSTFDTMYRTAMEERRTVEFVEFYAPLNGWFEVRAFPGEDGLSVYFRDITEQKQAQEALAYQSELTRTITENATAALFMMDAQGRTTFMNPAAERMIGYRLDEIRDVPLHDVIHHTHPDGTPFPISECPIDRALPEESGVSGHEDVFIRRDGTFFPVLCAALPISRDGVPVGTVVEVRDVTAEKRAQEELQRGEKRYRSLIEATAAIVWSTPPSGELHPPQPEWAAFTGQTDEELRGWGWLEAIHPDDRAHTSVAWDEALRNRAMYQTEHRLRRHDGEYRWMSVRGVPVLDEAGEIREWIGVHTDVTERREAELQRERLIAQLDVERARLQRVFNQAPAVIAMYSGPEHRVSVVNPTWEQVVGKRDVLGRPFREIFPELEGSGLFELLDQVYETGEPFVGNELQVFFDRDDDGELEESYWNFVWQPLSDDQGQVSEVFVHAVDVTQQVAARRDVERLEERLRLALESANVGTWDFHLETGALTWDERCRRIFGVDPDAVIAYDDFLARVHPEDRERTDRVVQLAFDPNGSGNYESDYRILLPDGEERWIRASGRAFFDGEGDARRAVRFIGTVMDVTDRKRAEAERERLIAEVDTERARLEQIFAEAPAVMALYSGPEHVVSMVNPTWEETVGKPDALGRPFREVFPELAGTGLFELLDRVYETGEAWSDAEVRVPLERWGSGVLEDTYWSLVWRPLPALGGHGRDILVHAVEVTQQVRARQEVERHAEELRRLARALEISNRELDQFAYVASHDLKAPLRGIANLSSWIEEDLSGHMTDDVRQHLDLLRGRVHRMEGLIDGILQYSRAGRVRERPEEVDTGALVRDVVDLIAAPEQVEIRIADDLPRLTAERLPLQQVFMNLIGNAVKYNDRPGAWVSVSAEDAGDFFHFVVADNGPGIAPEYHDRIFGIFQTLEARDKVEGTGIGLSLVKKIVENRGGRVWVESEEGSGAAFRFLWPKESPDE